MIKPYTMESGWFTKTVEQKVSVANATSKPAKNKIEVLIANYDLSNPTDCLIFF